jgi:hypothetical protein
MEKKSITKRNNLEPREYAQLLEKIKADILQTQLRAALSIPKELTLLYWRIGQALLEKMQSGRN